jgi:signal transduction histidine kinase
VKIYHKTIIIICCTVFILSAFLLSMSHLIILRSFQDLEDRMVRKSVEQALGALSSSIEELDSIAVDWASWDDTYAFIEDLNPMYIRSNLVDETFINLRLNMILYYDLEGHLVYGKAFDLERKMEVPVPDSLLHHLKLEDSLSTEPVRGLVILPEAPLLLSSRPITRSDGSGPVKGLLMMGRYLDDEEVRRLASVINLNMEITGFNEAPTDVRGALTSSETPILVRPLDGRVTAGYSLLYDIHGKPSLILALTQPREIYAQGLKTVSYFITSIIAVSILVSILILKLLERMVLSRISHLSSEVMRIEERGDPSLKVSVSGRDEISWLAERVNSMLERLHLQQEAIRLYNENLEKLVEERTRELIRAEKMAAAGEVSAMVAHDLKGPLQTIRNAVYLLKRGAKEPGPLLELIEGAVEQAGKILEDIHRDIKGTLNIEPVDLGALIRNAVKEAFPPPKISVSVRLGEGLDPIPLDPSRFRRVLDNLLRNSLEAMPSGGVLKISAEASGDKAIIKITDTGRGIPEEALKHLFEPFSTTKDEGWGLGLPYCKRVVEAHGGRITVESRVGEGTTFTIIIPRGGPPKIGPPSQP